MYRLCIRRCCKSAASALVQLQPSLTTAPTPRALSLLYPSSPLSLPLDQNNTPRSHSHWLRSQPLHSDSDSFTGRGPEKKMEGDGNVEKDMTRVLFCGPDFPASHEYTAEYLQDHSSIKVDVLPFEQVSKAIADYHVCIVKNMKLDSEIISRAVQMRLIMQYGVGLDGVDIEAATKHGIKVARIPGGATGNSASCAEMAIYLMLGLLRKQNELQISIQQRKLGEPITETLLGKTIFILGFGNIGMDLAHRLQPFGVKVIATKRSWTSYAQHPSKLSRSNADDVSKHLRKQFNDVANLLRQSGFLWDDTREMVAAEDNVWDAYIKVHPEARSLRVKTLPGYRKLCVIFGEDCSDTRCIRVSHSTDRSTELPMLITGEQKNSNFSRVYVAASTMDWTESMECCFVDLIIEQVNQGYRIGNLFNEQAWTHMTEEFNTKFGLQCDKQFLVNRYFCLMKQHDDISNLLSHSGFAWDETLQMIIAQNDIWDAYIKDHPDAISYKNRFLYLYCDLCNVFGNKASDARVSALEANDIAIEMDMDRKSGNLVVMSNADISDLDTDRPRETDMDGSSGNVVVSDNTEVSFQDRKGSNEIDMVGASGNLDVTSNNGTSYQGTERPSKIDTNGTSADLIVSGKTNKIGMNGSCRNLVTKGSAGISDHVKKRPSTVSLDSKPPKKDLRMKEALSEMASAVKALMKNKEKSNNNSLENALSALQAMPDLDEELVMDACDLLEDERMAKIFLALDISLRKKWLLRKLRQ